MVKWKNNRRGIIPGMLLCVVFLVIHCAAQSRSVTILHTNDMHGAFIPHEAFWSKESPKPMVGGFSELAFIVDSVRQAIPGVLLLDAGDVMTGNPITEYEYHGVKGGILLEMMNRIGYEAWCPGNHDFDVSQANLVGLTSIARFPTLCANLVNENDEFSVNNRSSVTIEKNGVRIGIIGLMSQSLYNLVNQNNLTGLKVLSPVTTAQKLIDELGPNVDLVVALTHQGIDEDSVLAANVNGLDVIIGGHTHTRLYKPKIVNGVIIAQAGSNCENLGELQVTVEGHRVTAYRGRLLPLYNHTGRASTPLTAMIDSVDGAIKHDYGEVIAHLGSEWSREGSGMALGNLITEAQRIAARARVAIMNLHGIRRTIGPGPLTKGDLFEVLPFRNVLSVFQLTGKELRSIVQYHLETESPITFAGLSCRWKKMPKGIKILSLEIGGKPVDNESAYICTANDYFIGEAQRYLGMELRNVTYLQQTVFDAVETNLRSHATIKPIRQKPIVKVR